MKYFILPDGRLKLIVDEEEQEYLQEVAWLDPDWGTEKMEAEALEELIANSELQWIPKGTVTGDLTEAPMLGLTEGFGCREHELPEKRFGEIEVGGDVLGKYYDPIIARWAYMDYQVRSFLDDLANKGECIWEGGYAQ